jgi:hypothetical protein
LAAKTTISVSRDNTEAATRKIDGFEFHVLVTVNSDDCNVKGLEIRQLVKSSTTMTDWNGKRLSRNDVLKLFKGVDPAVVDSDGAWVTDTKWDWKSLGEWETEDNPKQAVRGDKQELTLTEKNVLIEGKDKDTKLGVVRRTQTTLKYKIEVRKTSNPDKIIATHEWGYTWNNYNGDWSLDPALKAPPGYEGTVRDGLGSGGLLDVYGVTGLAALYQKKK